MSLFLELNNLMVKYRFKPDKKKGQHFIVNDAVIDKMVRAAELNPKDIVLEIGAGTGFLTKKLQEECRVIAVEKDERLCTLLGKELGEKNVQLVCSDYLHEKLPRYTKTVSFPPYFLSKKITLKLLKEKPVLCVLVFQREFGEKLQAMPGFKEYSALSVLAQYNYGIESIATVQSKCFFPRPKSDSSIIVMKKSERKEKAVEEKGFSAFVGEIFRHKNKNLSNALSHSKKFLGERVFRKHSIEKYKGIEIAQKKVNHLSVEELVSLYNSLYSETI